MSVCNLQIKNTTEWPMHQTLVSDWVTWTATSIFASYTLVCKQVNNGARGGSLGDLLQICSIDNVWEWGRNLQCTVLNLLWVLPFMHMFIWPFNIYGEPTPCWALSFSPLQSTPAEREIRRALQAPCPPQQWSAVGKAAWFQILPPPVTHLCLSVLISAMG